MKKLLLVLMMFTASLVCAQTNYYIATTGSDSNVCSSASPCRTANSVDARLISGALPTGASSTTINVLPGTYAETIITNKNGTSSAHIRYVSTTLYGARLVGTGSSSLVWTVKGQFTDIVGFDFDGSVNSTRTGVIMYAVGSNSQAVSTRASVLNNKLHSFCPSGGCRGQSALVSGGSTTGIFPSAPSGDLIAGNLIYHNDGGAGAVMFNDSDGGIDLGWQDIVQNNIVIDQGGGTCIQAGHTSKNVIVTNNTMLNCTRNGFILGCEFGCVDDNSTVSNNVIANSGNSGPIGGFGIVNITGGCQPNNLWSNNLMYGNIPSDWSTSRCSSQLINGQIGSNSNTFVSYTGTISGNYIPKSGSTAIANGTSNCGPNSGCVPLRDSAGNLQTAPPVIGYLVAVSGGGPPNPPTGLTVTVH